jgi:para-aminobenzoate synthetase component 1
VQGEIRSELTWKEILESLSPPGSISGAPKSSAISVIGDHETARGPYCGALGWVHGSDAELSVAIRIFWQNTKLHFGTGAGITWSSDPQQEWEETQLKARNLISIAGGVLN